MFRKIDVVDGRRIQVDCMETFRGSINDFESGRFFDGQIHQQWPMS